jgi:hypothetical protein
VVVLLGGGGTLVELLLLGVVSVVVEDGGLEVVVVPGSVEVGLAGLEVVEFDSSRFASCRMELATAGSARWRASTASRSEGNTPSRNRSGKYRWRRSWRVEGEADFSRAESDEESGASPGVW